jgi:capsular exopolysaccharide synthesis family protein
VLLRPVAAASGSSADSGSEETMNDSDSDAPALGHFLAVLRGGVWLILLAIGLTTATAVFVSLRQEERFKASADVFLRTQSVAASLGDVPQSTEDPERAAETQARLARAPAVARAALRAAGAEHRPAEGFFGYSSVSAAPDADFLTFSVTDSDRDLAKRLATAYATAYTRYRKNLDIESLVQARREIKRELRTLRARGEQTSRQYATLAESDHRLRTSELLQTANAALARPAENAQRIQPRPVRDAVLAGTFGLLFGVALAFMTDALNTRVRTAEEVEERLGLVLLGRIRELPLRTLGGRRTLTMLAAPGSAEAEAFRVLATNIDFVNPGREASKILFTSALRGEGKSATIANLAVAFARTGRHIVLVDLDLRAPSIHRLFGLSQEKSGVTRVALGQTKLNEALIPIPIVEDGDAAAQFAVDGAGQGTLEILLSGPLPPNPGEFIASTSSLTKILTQLAQRADLVLVDAPPILEVSETMALSTAVDATVIVTRIGELRRSVLNELRRVLEGAPIRKLGFVATGPKAVGDYQYGYGYTPADVDEFERRFERERL